MRKAMHRLLTEDPTLASLLPADKWFQRGSVPDKPVTPFAVEAWQGEEVRGKSLVVPRFTLWVYQSRGSYHIIDEVLRRATELLTSTVQYEYDGERLGQMDFEGSSVDLFDDVYRANTRNAGYRVIGSGL
jgi:hypothetical protein